MIFFQNVLHRKEHLESQIPTPNINLYGQQKGVKNAETAQMSSVTVRWNKLSLKKK